jgi:membrane-bound lytic murein transglycosylase A
MWCRRAPAWSAGRWLAGDGRIAGGRGLAAEDASMQIMRRFGYLGLLALMVTLFGCPHKPPVDIQPEKNYWKPLPPGETALVKLDPSQYPDFSEAYHHPKNLEIACYNSLEYLSKESSKKYFPYQDITHERAVKSVEAFLQVLKEAKSPEEMDRMIKERFEVYQSRGCDENGTVLFTGYYRPIFDARLKPDGEFKYPLYKKPDDLALNEQTMTYERKGGGPYLTRGEIEHGALNGKGLELCYLRDRFEAYIVTVQGSGKLRLEDGSFFEIGYAGDNGHEYTSVGQRLVERNIIPAKELSLQGLIKFFKEHPDELDASLAINNRYVFFTPRTGGPFGSLNVPVSPFRSIATDKQVYPRACVAFLTTLVPAPADGEIIPHRYRAFALDQDTGGAIRAAGRCDLFLGTGPEIGELAGRTLSEGKLYYIAVKE